MPRSQLARSLRLARERKGWSRETLAHHSGLSWAAIAQIESGRRQDVRLASVEALAGALGVTIDFLVGNSTTLPCTLFEHRVLIYDSDDAYLASAVPFLAEGVAGADCVLVVTDERQTRLLRDALGQDAASVEFRDSGEWYRTPIDALQLYRAFVNERFERDAAWVRIIGEPVWDRRSAAEVRAWMRYESMLNLSLATLPSTLVCPYDERSLPKKTIAGARQTHPEISESGDVVTSGTYRDPEDFLLI